MAFYLREIILLRGRPNPKYPYPFSFWHSSLLKILEFRKRPSPTRLETAAKQLLTLDIFKFYFSTFSNNNMHPNYIIVLQSTELWSRTSLFI